MASALCVLKWIGRVLFFVLFGLQTAMLVWIYLHFTIDEINWGSIVILIIVGLCALLVFITLVFIFCVENQLSKLWIVWIFYVIQLAVSIGAIIFATNFKEKIDEESFWNAGKLMKMTMCISLAIAVLLISTASDSRNHIHLVHQLCLYFAVHLSDTIEILGIILIAPVQSVLVLQHDLDLEPLIFSMKILFVLSLLLSPLRLLENEILNGGYRMRDMVYTGRLLFEMSINIGLIVVRLVAWLEFNHDAFIFIAKNAIIIVVSVVEMIKCGMSSDYENCKSHRCRCCSGSKY